MAEAKKPANQELVRAVWEEARDLIKRLEGSTVQRFSVEAGDTKIEIERGMPAGVVAGAMPAAAAGAPAMEEAGAPELDAGHPIKAPLVGTFYRASGPGAPPFVNEGDVVEVGQTVGIVEAMKLMNPIVADEAGVVAEVLVGDAESVEYDQVIMRLRPPGRSR